MVYFNVDIYLYQNLIMHLSLIGAEPSVIKKKSFQRGVPGV